MVLCLSCAPRNGATPATAEEEGKDQSTNQEKLARLRAWEATSLQRFDLELPDGILVGEVEAAAPPRVECHDNAGIHICSIALRLEADDDDDHIIECAATWGPPIPFGFSTDLVMRKLRLEELPRFEADWRDGSQPALVTTFSANGRHETDEATIVGTVKTAARYVPGHTLFCAETSSGGEETFARVVDGLFRTVQVKNLGSGLLIQNVTRERRGDTTSGFRFDYVVETDDGYAELSTRFHLITTDKGWDARDSTKTVARDRTGGVVSLRQVHSGDAKVLGVLTAKAAESGKLRLKFEHHGKSDAIELTPQAALSTEVWESPALLRVSKGRMPKHKYAFLAVAEDGDPTLGYSKFTRLNDGLVQEEVEFPGARRQAARSEKNELTIDPQGFVSKQVSSDSVEERLHHSGNMPKIGATRRPNSKVATLP